MDDKYTLENTVKLLVSGKYQLDFELAKLINDTDLLGKILLEWRGLSNPNKHWGLPTHLYALSMSPSRFVQDTLPFSQISHSLDGYVEDIDPFLVIGSTYKVYEEGNETISQKIERLNSLPDKPYMDLERINNGACYCKIGKLPLYVAREGKNRVLMYQSAKQPIRAIITRTEFPEPEELTIHPVLPFNLYAISCSNPIFYRNTGYSIAMLPFHELVLPLLSSYGVKVGKRIFSIKALLDWRQLRKEITSTFP